MQETPEATAHAELPEPIADDYRTALRTAVLNEATFVRLTMQGKVRGPSVPWHKIIVRPVLVRHQRHLQISYFDAKQDTTKNFLGGTAVAKVDEVIAIPFSSIRLETTDDTINIQITKKGKAIFHRERRDAAPSELTLDHNRTKALPLPAGTPDRYLRMLGIMNVQGQVRPQMQGKFTQINEFLKVLDSTGELERFDHSPITILDCGSGSAYLTFATYHYLNDIRGIPAQLTGIDVNDTLIRNSMEHVTQLGATDMCFLRSPIIEYHPEVAPDIVVALHACNTATDDAIAQSIGWGAQVLLCTPCCHHDLNDQLAADVLRPILRHGILKQRIGDLVTDAFRALVLRIMGYRTDVIEFVSPEHTAKNLMIRAIKATAPGDPSFIREYQALKDFWQVTPYLEQLLGQRFTALLQPAAL